MVLHKYGDRLYKGLQQAVDEHLKEVATTVAESNDETFMDALNKAWNDHKISMLMIRDILMYMVFRLGTCDRALVSHFLKTTHDYFALQGSSLCGPSQCALSLRFGPHPL